MFIRETVKQNKGYKKKFIYHNLMESYRTEKGPRQRLLLSLGELYLPREKWKSLANRIEEIINNQKSIFAVLQRLGFPGIFSDLGFTDTQRKIAQLLIVGRMVFPFSELRTYRWAQDISGIGELLSFDVSKVSHNRFYKVSDLLVNNQEAIEERLCKKERTLFSFTDKIILYDLTNTYFESGVGKSELKGYAVSKEKRNDCPVVTVGLVLNEAGFPERSKIFKGNINESETLLKMVKQLDTDGDNNQRKTVIIDAGLSKEDNLQALKLLNYDYICVARNRPLKEIPKDGFVTIRHTKKNKVEARLIKKEGESILYCRSLKKKLKEEAMKTKFQERFEADLKAVEDGLHKKGGTKNYEKVLQRIGRLREKHKRIAYFYHIDTRKKGDKAVHISWRLKSETKVDDRFSGSYYLRTSRTDLTEKEIWDLYVLLTDVEDSFRSMKSELGLRPSYHQLDKRIKGHLFITVLAYHVVNSILWLLHTKDIYLRWSTIRQFLSTQTRSITEMTKRDGNKIRIKTTSEPETFHKMIAKALLIKPKPLNNKILSL